MRALPGISPVAFGQPRCLSATVGLDKAYAMSAWWRIGANTYALEGRESIRATEVTANTHNLVMLETS